MNLQGCVRPLLGLLLAMFSTWTIAKGQAQETSHPGDRRLPSLSADPGTFDPDDLTLAGLRASAEAERLIDARRGPVDDQVNIYVAQSAAQVRLQAVELVIDDESPVDISFDATEAAALQTTNGVRRIGQLVLAEGPHTVRATFAIADQTNERIVTPLTIDQTFDKKSGERSLILQLEQWSLLSISRVSLSSWKGSYDDDGWMKQARRNLRASNANRIFTIGAPDDPIMRYSRYLIEQGDADGAVIELLKLRLSTPAEAELPTEYQLRLADAYIARGFLDDADTILGTLDGSLDPHTIALSRLRLAEGELSKGRLQLAERVLMQARPDVPDVYAIQWRFVYAQLLFAGNRPTEAIGLLRVQEPDDVEAFRALNAPVDARRADAFRRFNLGVTLLRSGEELRGLSWLDQLGRTKDSDPEILALRDRANLTIGWHFLAAKQGATALGLLGRVCGDGPFSNAAMLGVGWAQLVPGGKKIERKRLRDELSPLPDLTQKLPSSTKRSLTQLGILQPELHGEAGPRAFSRDPPPADTVTGLQHAIQIWSLIIDRDPDDPAVLEAALAIGYAFDQLEQTTSARGAFSRAIALLEATSDRISADQKQIAEGFLTAENQTAENHVALLRTLNRIGLAPELTSRVFFRRLSNYQATSRLLERLSSYEREILADASAADSVRPPQDLHTDDIRSLSSRVQAIESGLAIARADEANYMQATALHYLEDQKSLLNNYRRAAYLSASRAEDRQVEGGHPYKDAALK